MLEDLMLLLGDLMLVLGDLGAVVLVAAHFAENSMKSPLSSGHSGAEKTWGFSLPLGISPSVWGGFHPTVLVWGGVSPPVFVSTSTFSSFPPPAPRRLGRKEAFAGWAGGYASILKEPPVWRLLKSCRDPGCCWGLGWATG